MNWHKFFSKARKVVAILGVPIFAVVILMETPLREKFLEFFKSSSDFAQAAVLGLAGAAIIGLGIWKLDDQRQIKKIEEERDEWKNKFNQQEEEEKERWKFAACSDWVLIPTTLDIPSLDGVPRTLSWIQKMVNSQVLVAPRVSIVLNKARYYGKKLVKKQFERLEDMKSAIAQEGIHIDYSIFEEVGIPEQDALSGQEAVKAVPVCDKRNKSVRNSFLKLAEEFRKKVGI